jgi:hypothetical protein
MGDAADSGFHRISDSYPFTSKGQGVCMEPRGVYGCMYVCTGWKVLSIVEYLQLPPWSYDDAPPLRPWMDHH